MKATMQLDPGVDVVANRLPNVFINHAKTGDRLFVEQIERLARTRPGRCAGDLPGRRQLDAEPVGARYRPVGAGWAGLDLADRARGMPNLLPPRSGGAFAAIMACPEGRRDLRSPRRAGPAGQRRVTSGVTWPSAR